MINLRFTTDLPVQMKDGLPAAMVKVAALMKQSVVLTMLTGGRPHAWPALKSGGETPLIASGRLLRSIWAKSGARWAEVQAGEGLPYAEIQHYGGLIHQTVTERQRKFFWYMFAETGNSMWKAMALSNELNIRIPKRPYMMLQPQDVERILRLIGNFVLTGDRTAYG